MKLVVSVSDQMFLEIKDPIIYQLFLGGHKVNVKYGGKHAPGSPFKVPISPKSDASKVKVTGPGVEKTGVQPGKPTWFIINATEAGKGDVHVKIEPRGLF